MKKLTLAMLTLGFCGMACAKLPAPTPEAAAAAAAAKDKAAWGDKVAAYKLCLAQDKVAARYVKEKGAKKSTVAVPPCADPGPYTPSPTPAATASATGSAPAAAPSTAAGVAAVQSAQAPAPAKK